MESRDKKRILVVGGGFAGVECILKLESYFGNNHSFETTLVSEDNFLLFTPMLPQVAAGTIEDVEKIVTGAAPTQDSTPLKHKEVWEKRDETLSDAIDKRHIPDISTSPQHEPDQSDSPIQNQSGGKWCYVGTDRGYRSCVEMKDSQSCISGKIFPSKMKCVNPEIRDDV